MFIHYEQVNDRLLILLLDKLVGCRAGYFNSNYVGIYLFGCPPRDLRPLLMRFYLSFVPLMPRRIIPPLFKDRAPIRLQLNVLS